MNLKKAKKLRKLISHIDDKRLVKFVRGNTAKRAIWQKDGNIRVEEFSTANARANIKRVIYQAMKKYVDEPDVIEELISGLEQAVEEQRLQEELPEATTSKNNTNDHSSDVSTKEGDS